MTLRLRKTLVYLSFVVVLAAATRPAVASLPDGDDGPPVPVAKCEDVSPYGPGGCLSSNECDGWPQNLCLQVGIGPGATCHCEY